MTGDALCPGNMVSDMVVLSNRGGSNLIFLHEDDGF